MQQVTEQNLENVWLKFFQSVAKDLRNTVNAHVKYTSISLCIYVYIYMSRYSHMLWRGGPVKVFFVDMAKVWLKSSFLG